MNEQNALVGRVTGKMLTESLFLSIIPVAAILLMVQELRIRGLQHQINEVRADQKAHLQDAPNVKALLSRLDERTEQMDKRIERIDRNLNGGIS